jgi:hypothetical protein
MSFWCITTFFNPAGYKTLLNNYNLFANKLLSQKVNLLTIEASFDNQFYIDNSIKLHSNSVMWLKERLINYAESLLPPDCNAFAWIDADVLFAQDDWHILAQKKLEKVDVLQLFKRIFHLPPGHDSYQDKIVGSLYSITWQQNKYYQWLENRKNKNLPFAAPGFAWAARRDTFRHVNGLYDKDVIGSGDCVLVDSLLNSWDLHGYVHKFNDKMKEDIQKWCNNLNKKKLKIDYLPVDIFHLWHGDLKNRKYMQRHFILKDYDPNKDIKLENNVYVWNTDKPKMHQEIKDYFYDRLDDS